MGVELYLNGAFFSGVGLDSSELLTGDYERTQQSVCSAIGGVADEWRYDRISDGPSRLRFSVKRKYASLIPVSFISRAGPPPRQDLDRRVAKPGALDEGARAAWRRLGLEITEVDIDMFDLGVGVVAVRATVKQSDLAVTDLRADVEEVSSALVAVLNDLVASTIDEFSRGVRAAIPAAVLEVPWFQEEGSVSGFRNDRTAAGRPLGLTPPGQLLWLHRIYIFGTCPPEIETKLDDLLPSVYQRESLRNLHFLPGIGSTVIACREQRDRDAIGLLSVEDILALMDLQWAYIAAAMEIDRTLFRRLHQFTVNAQGARPAELERGAAQASQLASALSRLSNPAPARGYGAARHSARRRKRVADDATALCRVRAGSASFTYAAGAEGIRLTGYLNGHGIPRARTVYEPGVSFVDHSVACSELYLRLVEAERTGSVEVLEHQAEPDSWRTFLGAIGARLSLRPDAFVALGVGEFEQRSFVEIDRGTEGSSALRRKLSSYLDYWRSGAEQQAHEVFPRVVWQVGSDKRADVLRALIDELSESSRLLFSVTGPTGIVDQLCGAETQPGGAP